VSGPPFEQTRQGLFAIAVGNLLRGIVPDDMEVIVVVIRDGDLANPAMASTFNLQRIGAVLRAAAACADGASEKARDQ
jgi:hypothetical protein